MSDSSAYVAKEDKVSSEDSIPMRRRGEVSATARKGGADQPTEREGRVGVVQCCKQLVCRVLVVQSFNIVADGPKTLSKLGVLY